MDYNKTYSWKKLSDDSYSGLITYIRPILDCRAKSERLDSLGIERGSVVFSSYSKTYNYKKKGNSDSGNISDAKNVGRHNVRRYTNIYIMHNHIKEYVSKKKTPFKLLLKLQQLAVRTELSLFTKAYSSAARISCNIYNASRPRSAPYIDFDSLLESEYSAYKNTVQYANAVSDIDSELADASASALMGRMDYKNEIYLNFHERYRSKNELIAACALNAAGIPYEIEPPYPGVSRCRADFGLNVSGRRIYIEIAGMMNDENYRRDLFEKRRLAKLNNLPFVIVDMTDYEDPSGKNRTRLHFGILKRIFIDIYSGKIKCAGEIIKPYINSP